MERNDRISRGGTKLIEQKSEDVTHYNEFREYKKKQEEIQNFRIEKMLTPRSNNPELQKYLEDKVNYETASLGETSADELSLKSPLSGEDSDKRVDIYRDSRLANEFDHIKNLSN